jgi:adenylate kinase family enzyme
MRIILLLGASSSGKSTLCNEVQASTNPKWKVRDTDTFANHCINQAITAFSKNHDIQGLLSDLAVSPDKIVNFVMTGKLQPGKNKDDNNPPTPHQFDNPELDNVEQVLKELKIEDARIPILADELRNVIKYRTELIALLPEPNQEFLNRFFEYIFSETFEPDDTTYS